MTRFANLHRVGLLSFAALILLVRTTNLLAQETTPKTEAQQPTAPIKKSMPLKVTVTTDKKIYAVGTPLKMTLLVKNATKETVQLHFSSGQRFDFVLREGTKPEGKIVWQWARSHMFTMMLTSEKLEPGKPLTFAAVYDPSIVEVPGRPNQRLAAGVYTLTATLTTMGPDLQPTGMTQIRIK